MFKDSFDRTYGIFCVDKDIGEYSTDVVRKIRKAVGNKKVGHAGTLDPFASGVLIVCVGEATKIIEYIQDADKEYIFDLKFGFETDTLDHTGNIVAESKFVPKMSDILKVIPEFIGNISQIPPKYSALKINGKRAYDLAREGVDFEIKPRNINIYSLKILDKIDDCTYRFKVKCSKGTYIRTLGQDIARKLGGMGHLSMLRRTCIGNISIDKCKNLETISNSIYNGDNLFVYSIESLLVGIPVLTVEYNEMIDIINGKTLNKQLDDGLFQLHYNNTLISVSEALDNVIKPIKNFNLISHKE